MAVHRRKVDPDGGLVDVELSADHRHVLSYKCVLMKGDGSSQQVVLRGTTIDTLPDQIILPFPAAQLSGLFLAVDGLLSPMKAGGDGQDFRIEITFRQAGAVIGEPVVVSHKTTMTVPILEHVEL